MAATAATRGTSAVPDRTGHCCVADELLDRAAVALEDRAQLCVIASHQLAQGFGIGALAERRRADEVTEEDGDRLTHAGGCLGCELGTAAPTEAEAVRILLAAGRTACHRPSLGNDLRGARHAALRMESRAPHPRNGFSVASAASRRPASPSRSVGGRRIGGGTAATCRCGPGACTPASSRAGAGHPPAPPEFCECDAPASSSAWHPRSSR
jgi:hypothetical protein